MFEKEKIEGFIKRWAASGAAERANKDQFFLEFCALLGIETPDPDREKHPNFRFEKAVRIPLEDGRETSDSIDFYKKGFFVIEAKQGSEAGDATIGTARRGTATWDKAMRGAFGQALKYASYLPEGKPPFLITADIGNCFEVWSSFSGDYGGYGARRTIEIAQLADSSVFEFFVKVFTDPLDLDPARHAQKVTRLVAAHLAELARDLERSGHDPELVAQFLMRCIFTMFAEDVGLLPGALFTRAVEERWLPEPRRFQVEVEQLWRAMNDGLPFGYESQLLRFNGGLFSHTQSLPMNADQLKLLLEAAKCDWSNVEPTIFGTLLERALDPVERQKLGAHFTPREYIERLVRPAVIEPLRGEWEIAQAQARQILDKGSPWQNKRILPDYWHHANRYNLCPATTAYKNYILNRDKIIHAGNYEFPRGDKPLDGLYHDIGFTFLPQKCFMCEVPAIVPPQDVNEVHDHFSADGIEPFQVGSGGFLNRACREVLTYKLYGQAHPPINAPRREIFGTEGMTEILLDLVDCSGNATTWGPLKDLTYAKIDNINYHEDNWKDMFGGWFYWIYNRHCAEVPMMQYVYNPLMTLKIAGHGNLSGGLGPLPHEFPAAYAHEHSAHNICSIFYWLAGKSYLSGMIMRLDYDQCPIDVLSKMDPKAPTYMLGWHRLTKDPEWPYKPPMDEFYNPNPGKHPYSKENFFEPDQNEFNKHNRTYGDPQKEQFLRMMAYMRTYVVPEFLVYGDMIHPGTIPNDQNKLHNFEYEYYFAMGASEHWSDDGSYGKKARADQLEHRGHWLARPLLTSAWKEYDPDGYEPPHYPSVLYILINSGDSTKSFHYSIALDVYGGKAVRYDTLQMKPNDEDKWEDWRVNPQLLQPQDGWIRHVFPVSLGPNEIYLIKISPSPQSINYG